MERLEGWKDDPGADAAHALSAHRSIVPSFRRPAGAGRAPARYPVRVAHAQVHPQFTTADRGGLLVVEPVRRSEEHTSELQSPDHLVCRLLLEKKKKNHTHTKNHKF